MASIVVPITTAPSSKVWPTGLFARGANMFGDNIAITQPLDPNVDSDGYWRNLLRRSIYRSIYVQPMRNAE